MNKQQRLRYIFGQLPSEQQKNLLEFAEFLYQRNNSTVQSLAIPQIKPRPADESVVAAIKRLAHSYPMLNKAAMLDDTSRLMTEHVLQGHDKIAVIDELEALFLRHYEQFTNEQAAL